MLTRSNADGRLRPRADVSPGEQFSKSLCSTILQMAEPGGVFIARLAQYQVGRNDVDVVHLV